MRRAIPRLLIGCGCLLLAASARAQEADERPFSWRPSIQMRGLWTDNIGLTAPRRESDFGLFATPRVEAAYRAEAYELDFDGAVDVRRYTDDAALDDVFYRVNTGAEVGLLPGLSMRLSDAYAPTVRSLGLPDDDPANLIQSNRAEVEMRYWRELPGSRELAVGAVGGRFDTESFATTVAGPGGTLVTDPRFHADFWEAGGYAEFQNPIGEHHAGYLRGTVRHRSFDDDSDGDHLQVSGLAGFRTHLEPGLELDVAGGYGWLDFGGGQDESSWLARADLNLRRPDGWRFQLGFHHELTVDIAGKDFQDTTGRIGVEKYLGTRTALGVIGFLSQLHSDATRPRGNLFGGFEVKVRRQLVRRVTASLAYRYWENAGSFRLDALRRSVSPPGRLANGADASVRLRRRGPCAILIRWPEGVFGCPIHLQGHHADHQQESRIRRCGRGGADEVADHGDRPGAGRPAR
jgi:hypothetical protein